MKILHALLSPGTTRLDMPVILTIVKSRLEESTMLLRMIKKPSATIEAEEI